MVGMDALLTRYGFAVKSAQYAPKTQVLSLADAQRLTLSLACEMADTARNQGDARWTRRFQRTIYARCLTGDCDAPFCGEWWCLVCARNRMADWQNHRLPVVETWSRPALAVTSLRAVPGEALPDRLRRLRRDAGADLRWARRKGHDTTGIRKLEITFNARTNTFNPHLTTLHSTLTTADAMRERWVSTHRESADAAGQYADEAENPLCCLRYLAKPAVPAWDDDWNRSTPAPALLTAYQALSGCHVVQPLGTWPAPQADDALGF